MPPYSELKPSFTIAPLFFTALAVRFPKLVSSIKVLTGLT